VVPSAGLDYPASYFLADAVTVIALPGFLISPELILLELAVPVGERTLLGCSLLLPPKQTGLGNFRTAVALRPPLCCWTLNLESWTYLLVLLEKLKDC
jgi:hypothetical protein